MSSIDRVRYYDGEFLRAFDFGDEQTYHMEMRRMLNRYLHLYGIVRGLQLYQDPTAPVNQVSILTGLAIDAFGREIYVFAPYTFGDADIRANDIRLGGNYDVWLRYNKTASTPPSAGYAQCNQTNQYTRWLESYRVVLLQSPSHPFTPPAFTDDDTDDPSEDQVGVLLGSVYIDLSSVTKQFSVSSISRSPHFMGIIAQSIQTPPGYDATSVFNFLGKQSAWNPPVSLEIEPNIFARQNMILGPDFDTTVTPLAPATSAKGNAKIATDLYVQGNIYANVNIQGTQQFLNVSNYIQQLSQQSTPNFVATTAPQVFPVNPTAALTVSGFYSDIVVVTIPSTLSSMSNVVATAAIAGFTFNTAVPDPSSVQLVITGVKGIPGSSTCSVQVNFTVSPVTAALVPPISSFAISAMAVCFPS